MYDDSILLKEKLSEIKKNDFTVPDDVSAFDLVQSMMKNIGSTDPELRDYLIHRVICNWIDRKEITNEQIIELLNMSMDDNHLFYKIGLEEDDSVFKRTFCALNVAQILYVHRSNKFLSNNTIKNVKEKVIQYYLEERDLRSYVTNKGWADSASHGADALDELAQCDCINNDDLHEILNAVKRKVCINYYTYIDFEDERITNVVVSTINRNLLNHSEMIDWIKDFRNFTKTGQIQIDFHIQMNIRNFLRSLYFRLLKKDNTQPIIEAIKETLTYVDSQ